MPTATSRATTSLLKPLEIVERAEVSSVYVETSVQDKTGRFVTGPRPVGVLARSKTACRRRWTSSAPSSCRRPTRCSSTAARAWRGASTSSATPRRSSAVVPAREGPDHRRAVLPNARRRSPARPTIARPWPTRSRRSSPGAARRSSTRWRTPPRLIASLEGRHAIILLTDGYDEHSTQAFDDALAAVQRTGAAVYVVGIGGVAGISLKGERFLRQAGQRHRRPGVLPDARDRAASRSTSWSPTR